MLQIQNWKLSCCTSWRGQICHPGCRYLCIYLFTDSCVTCIINSWCIRALSLFLKYRAIFLTAEFRSWRGGVDAVRNVLHGWVSLMLSYICCWIASMVSFELRIYVVWASTLLDTYENVFHYLRTKVCGSSQSRAQTREAYWDIRVWRVHNLLISSFKYFLFSGGQLFGVFLLQICIFYV